MREFPIPEAAGFANLVQGRGRICRFAACSTFMAIMACRLAASPKGTHLARRLRRFHFSTVAPIITG